MKNSIEVTWKEGFLNEKSLVAPKVNDLYNQKSRHVVDRITERFKINVMVMVVMAVMFPVINYFLGAFWEGLATSILLLLTAGYSKQLMNNLPTLDQGATSLDYLKSFDAWLKDVLARSERVVRFSYPLYFLIAVSIIWSAFTQQRALMVSTQHKHPEWMWVGDVPLVALMVVALITFLMFYFSDRIYRWDVRLMYGGLFDRLQKTIREMESLKED